MSYYVTAIYNHPADAQARAAFDEYYANTHTPLAKTLPGLQELTVFHPDDAPDGTKAPYYLIAILKYASAEACQESFGSEIGQTVLADVPKFAFQGVTLAQGTSVE